MFRRKRPETSEPPSRSAALLRSYKHARFMRRLMLWGFFSVFVWLLCYAVPWVPGGLSESDYNQRTLFLMVLVTMSCVTAFGAVYMREQSNRVEQTMLTWSTVHEGLGDLRRREYFYDRLVIECQRAQSSGNEFTVVALRTREHEDNPNADGIMRALIALEPVVHDSDCLAALGPHEIGVLAPRIKSSDAPDFADHLKHLLAAASTRREATEVSAGWAVYGVDADEAGALVGIARERMLGRSPTPGAVDAVEAPAANAETAA